MDVDKRDVIVVYIEIFLNFTDKTKDSSRLLNRQGQRTASTEEELLSHDSDNQEESMVSILAHFQYSARICTPRPEFTS